jgi:hypothetical protein
VLYVRYRNALNKLPVNNPDINKSSYTSQGKIGVSVHDSSILVRSPKFVHLKDNTFCTSVADPDPVRSGPFWSDPDLFGRIRTFLVGSRRLGPDTDLGPNK